MSKGIYHLIPAILLFCFSAGFVSYHSAGAEAHPWYILKEHSGSIEKLYLIDCTMYQAVKLMEQHMRAKITFDQAVEKRLKETRVSMTFQPMSWRPAFITLVISQHFLLNQTDITHYVITGGSPGAVSHLIYGSEPK